MSKRRSAQGSRMAARVAGVASLLIALETLSRTGVVPRQWFPPVSEIYIRLADLVLTAEFWGQVGATLQGWAWGLGIAAIGAVPAGMLIGMNHTVYRACRVLIEFLRPIPSVALIPVAVLVWGAGLGTKVFLAAFAAFWPLLFQALYGVREVDPTARETVRSYGLGPVARFRHVTVPSATPFIATGLRISSSIALILAVVAELVAGSPGLGRAITTAQSALAVSTMYALILATGLIGWLLNGIFVRVENRALYWHKAQR